MADARDIVAFWQQAGAKRWFRKNARFDGQFRDRFALEYSAAAQGRLSDWRSSAQGCLALLILLDQYPRNAFRGSPQMFATDALALAVTRTALASSFDQQVSADLRQFFYLPLMHSESLADQAQSVELCRGQSAENLKYALIHHDVIARFGRFPHRNAILARQSSAAERDFLATGGFAG